MVIIFDCQLTEPPSSVHCFRDVTLYSEVFLRNENIIKCPSGTRSFYWEWIKKYGAHDFVKGIISNEEDQEGLTIGEGCNINFKILNEISVSQLILALINTRKI